MKFNLKNFPRFKGDIGKYLDEVIPWKIGFEKELRELYEGKDFSARVLIQHILCKTGEEILGDGSS